MNSQLQRIKKKDYAALDNQLLMHMTQIQSLNSTVSNLKELQSLMDAMSKNNQNKPKHQNNETAMYKKSCSNQNQTIISNKKCENCNKYAKLMQKLPSQILSLKKYIKTTMKQLPNILSSMKHELNNLSKSYREMILQLIKSDQQRQQLKSEIKLILQTNQQLKEQKQKLKNICDQWEKARQRRRSNRASKENISKYLQTQDLTHIPKMPYPLTKKVQKQATIAKLQLKQILEDKTIDLEIQDNKTSSHRLSKSIHALKVNSSRSSLEKLSKQLVDSNSITLHSSKNLLLQKKGLKVTSEFKSNSRHKMQGLISKY